LNGQRLPTPQASHCCTQDEQSKLQAGQRAARDSFEQNAFYCGLTHASGSIYRENHMIDHTLDTTRGILLVQVKDSLREGDFVELAKTVDPYIEQTGDLAGIIIETPSFPGWESLGAMAAHFRFVRDHHKHIRKVGLVTDSALGKVAEQLASHFVSAEIRHFPVGELEVAKQWVMDRT
jgi:hypothetical protein